MKIGVVGANGFIGSHIVKNLSVPWNRVYKITRENFASFSEPVDVMVFAAGNASKHSARNNPQADFYESVIDVAYALYEYKYKKFILISSIDAAYTGVYSAHKRCAENIVSGGNGNAILRCGAVIGKGMKKGLIYDLINKIPVRISPESELPFISARTVARVVGDIIKHDLCGGFTVTGKGVVSPLQAAKILGVEFKYADKTETQKYQAQNNKNFRYIKESIEYVKKSKCVNG